MLRLFQKSLRRDSPFPLSKSLLDDLELAEYLRRYFDDPARYITDDMEAIRERNAICMALLKNDALAAAMQRLYVALVQVLETSTTANAEPIQIVRSMIGVRLFYDAALAASQAIMACGEQSASFTALSGGLRELLSRKYPANFTEAWDKYAGGVEKLGSMSYHIRFSDDLAIDTIALSGVYSRRFAKSSLIGRISGAPEPMRVDALLALAPGDHSEMSKAIDPHREKNALQRFSLSVERMLFTQTAVSKGQISAMERGLASDVRGLAEDLRFALGMLEYAQNIRAYSRHVCFAEIRGLEERSLCAGKMVHPLIAEQTDAVRNDISINTDREFILLGGVNRGGKTTYLRTAGSLQVLFQMGLPVPAQWAKISPASGIFSVFSKAENTQLCQGKLGQELADMRDAIAALDGRGMFLGNEPISATSPAESHLLSKESLCMLKAKHARGIWVTHLYDLFKDVDDINSLNLGSRIVCMHTQSVGGERSFAIIPGMPDNYSAAKEVFWG